MKLLWAVGAAIFTGGVWVSSIQINLNNHAKAIEEQRAANVTEQAAIRALELKDSSDTQLLRSIIEKLERIERKLNP